MKRTIPHARVLLAAACLLALSAVALFDPAVRAQGPAGGSRAEQFKQMSVRAETTGLAEPYVGITNNGKVEPGLFSLESTGVSTAPVEDQGCDAATHDERALLREPDPILGLEDDDVVVPGAAPVRREWSLAGGSSTSEEHPQEAPAEANPS